jgi:hypothetical protein
MNSGANDFFLQPPKLATQNNTKGAMVLETNETRPLKKWRSRPPVSNSKHHSPIK